jgi:hypothetical protein
MSDYVVTGRRERVELDASDVLKQALRLYRRLFTRSLLMGAIVFGALHAVDQLLRSGRSGAAIAFLSLVLTVAGVSLLQAGLAGIVRGLYVDRDDDASIAEALRRSADRILKLVRVSLLSGLGVGAAFLLLIVPGFVLMTRWAVAVPVAMLEDGGARDALRRSRAIVRGNGWNVFKVLFAVGVLTALVSVPFTLAAHGAGHWRGGWERRSRRC